MTTAPDWRSSPAVRLALCVAVGLVVALLPDPAGVPPAGGRLLGIFAGLILALVLRPAPMGALVVYALLVAVLTKSLVQPGVVDGETVGTFKHQMRAATAGYGRSVVWLVVGAFLIATAVKATGLGRRIALLLVSKLGRTTLGLGYAQAGAELVLGPAVPSNTARGGGILSPISRSVCAALGSDPKTSPEKAGRYLTLVGAHANLVTAAMFLTGMAANSLVSEASESVYGLEFGWGRWALACLVPGLVSLALLPLVLHMLTQPTVRDGRPAQAAARAELAALGPLSRGERVMLVVFAAMIAMWATSTWTGLDTALVAWLGVAALLATGTRAWSDVARDHETWDALVWLGGLLTLADGLGSLAVVDWFAGAMGDVVDGWGVLPTLLVLALAYFYSMYAFSMLTAHISAMAVPFLAVCAAADVPGAIAVPLIAAFSNLCACTTIYSTGPVVIYFGSGYVDAPRWFRVGFLVSLLHLAVWIPLGLAWWKLLGWW